MSDREVAPHHTRVNLNDARTISANTIKVFKIHIGNATGLVRTVTFRDNDNNILMTVTVPSNDNEVIKAGWIADNGLLIDSLSQTFVSVTVFHSAIGI